MPVCLVKTELYVACMIIFLLFLGCAAENDEDNTIEQEPPEVELDLGASRDALRTDDEAVKRYI